MSPVRNTHELRIKAVGQFCNDLPCLRVTLDGRTVHDGAVEELDLRIELPRTACVLTLEHYDKRFGENRRWDTRTENGAIVQDRLVVLQDISLDGISMMQSLHKLKFHQRPASGEPIIDDVRFTGTFNFNGNVSIDMSPNPMNWLIDLLFKQDHKDISYFSDYSKLFHYERERKLIEEIKGMMDGIEF